MSRRHIFAISIAVAVVLTAALALLTNVIANDPGVAIWLKGQPWLSTRRLVLAFAALVVASAAMSIWQYWASGTSERVTRASQALLDPDLRLQLLDKIQRERVDPRLRQGLRTAIRVDLGFTETPGAVQPKLREYVTSESHTVADRPIEGPIQDLFQQAAGGRLLILGEPGTGKTNLLLELAGSLITEAKRDAVLPIPTVFNLSRWTMGKRARTLSEWLKDELAAEYGLSRATADALITQDRILPLLDGLDEVSEQHRGVCAEAIMAFQKGRDLGSLVICCRTTEYASIPKLELGTAIQVEKLTRADIEREIARPRLARVRQALKSDPELWEVIDTPLWLHVLYLAAQVESPSNVPNPRDRLYARYIEYALSRTAEGSPRKRTAQEPMLRWLGWLAAEMQRRSQSQFALEDLSWSWLDSKHAHRIAWWFELLVASLVSALFLWGGMLPVILNGRLKDSWPVGLGLLSCGPLLGPAVLGLGSRLAMRHEEMRHILDRPTEELRLAWPDSGYFPPWAYVVASLPAALFGLIYALAAGIVFGKATGAATGLALALLFWILLGSTVFLQPLPVTGRTSPNSSVLRSSRSALVTILLGTILLFAGTLGYFHVPLVLWHIPSHYARLTRLMWIGFFSGAISVLVALSAFFRGGGFTLRNYSTRFSLWRLRLVPLRYVRFLNEATERLFLIRHGGSYEFFHVTFRDYMADAHGPNANVRMHAN